jgi:hypothetical protein
MSDAIPSLLVIWAGAGGMYTLYTHGFLIGLCARLYDDIPFCVHYRRAHEYATMSIIRHPIARQSIHPSDQRQRWTVCAYRGIDSLFRVCRGRADVRHAIQSKSRSSSVYSQPVDSRFGSTDVDSDVHFLIGGPSCDVSCFNGRWTPKTTTCGPVVLGVRCTARVPCSILPMGPFDAGRRRVGHGPSWGPSDPGPRVRPRSSRPNAEGTDAHVTRLIRAGQDRPFRIRATVTGRACPSGRRAMANAACDSHTGTDTGSDA